MKNIRCAFVASYYGPYYSNYVASVLALEKKMQEKGYSSIYVFPSEVKDFEWIHMLEKLNSKIYYVNFAPYSIANLKELRRIFKKEEINLIYSRMGGWDFTSHFAMPMLPIIWHMDLFVNTKVFSKKIKNLLKYRILAFGKTYHIAVSYPLGDVINSLKPKHKCKTIPNAIDFSRLSDTIYEKPDKMPYKLLLFGWDPWIKGLDTVLDACEYINTNEQRVQLLVSSQEKTYEFMKERYKEKPTWVELIPPTDHISELYDCADIMISASRSESFSYCLAEAIYSGVKVVYSDIPGTSWVEEFKNGVVFKTGDEKDIVTAIRRAINIKQTEDDIYSNRRLMREKYSMDSWCTGIIDFIENEIQ